MQPASWTAYRRGASVIVWSRPVYPTAPIASVAVHAGTLRVEGRKPTIDKTRNAPVQGALRIEGRKPIVEQIRRHRPPGRR